MKKSSVSRLFLIVAICSHVLITGCAEKGPVLLTVNYLPPAEKTVFTAKVIVGISPFKDGRDKPATVVGRRTIPSGLQDDLVVQGTIAETVKGRLKDAFIARGIAVKEIGDWDLTAEGIRAEGAGLLLGGEIRTLWLESTAVPFKTNLKAVVQLRVVAGDVAEKRIIRSIEVNSRIEQDVFYSKEKLEGVLSEALSSALDQIFQDSELRKKM